MVVPILAVGHMPLSRPPRLTKTLKVAELGLAVDVNASHTRSESRQQQQLDPQRIYQ